MNPSPFINMYYFYLLQSINKPNEIYTGSTNTLRLRLSEHNQGKALSTKRYLPWRLIYDEAYLSEKDARLREQKFKPLTISSKKGEGFTLTEILVAVAIFMLAMLIATSVFMVATMHQRQTAAGQALQSDIRFAMESIVRDVKYGTIDYDFYLNGTCVSGSTSYCSNDINNTSCPAVPCVVILSSDPVGILALRNVDGNRTRYRVDTTQQKLMVCKIKIADDALSDCDDMTTSGNWSPVTPDNVEMKRGDFYLYPFADPLALSGAAAGSPYKADDQPRVTVILKTVQKYPNGGIQQFITSQTTAVSRLYSR